MMHPLIYYSERTSEDTGRVTFIIIIIIVVRVKARGMTMLIMRW